MAEERARTELSPQMPLELALDGEATLENFLPSESLAPLLAYLGGGLESFEAVTYLHGGSATGKSHLLQALCHRHPGAVYLPLVQLHSLPPQALLQDLERAVLLAIDDLQVVAGRSDWEEALFHLLNRARAAACPVCVAASTPAGNVGIQLRDLSSRLAGGITWAVAEPGDGEKRAVLRFRARRRGLSLSDAVLDYLCARERRALPDLLASLDQLDRASLQLQKPVTVPLVRETMGW